MSTAVRAEIAGNGTADALQLRHFFGEPPPLLGVVRLNTSGTLDPLSSPFGTAEAQGDRRRARFARSGR
eukprot:5310076-Prymnesium_polylepis.1